AATAPGFVELCEADVKTADYRQNEDGESDNLGAGIYLAYQFAGELSQEDLRVVAPRCRRGFHRRLFDKWRHVRAVAAARYQGGCGGNRKKMNRWTRWANPNFVPVVNAFLGFDRSAVELYFQVRINAGDPVNAILAGQLNHG